MRVGTIGSGFIVHDFLDAVQAAKGISCEAVYSRDREKGEALAGEYGVKKVYTELEAMFLDEEVDVIYVASPNSLHYPQTKLALEYGKHVICEKPFAPRKEEALELVELARAKNLFLFDAVPPSFGPNYRAVKQALDRIGRIRLVMSNYSQYSSRYDVLLEGKITNVFSRDFAGGCLQDIGFYNLYFNIAMFGKPESFVYYPNMYPGQVDTSGVLMLQYNDFISSNVCAKDTWGVNYVQIEGEKGYIYVKGGCNAVLELKVVTRDGEETINLQDGRPRMNYEVEGIVRIMAEADYGERDRRLAVMLDVIETLECSRKAAGIYFAGEASADRC